MYTEYENNGDGNKTRSIEEYRSKFRAYLKDIINDLKKIDHGKPKTKAVISMFSKDTETCNAFKQVIDLYIEEVTEEVFNHFFLDIKLG